MTKGLFNAAAAVTLGLATLAMSPAAEAGSINITVTPKGKVARFIEKGLALYDKARPNSAKVEQSGSGNGAGIAQSGSGNVGRIIQRGSGNTGTLTQTGNNNAFALIQLGKNRSSSVTQTGNGKVGFRLQAGW